ncbi:uncharacterized protein TNIN_1531 [Trichonephila inaurata madagascariensis]|uniref:Uncharacterized protein n=1 Tax=Trichonephila inaurata madagascariensis TaxID=2747483 RepID=A0A8X6X9J2_9ARAC|nr:uncharacterized protein TNIN_1531 [Trichonephila inaurata madagascariensis]
MLGGAQSEENSLAQSSQDLRVDSGNVDETEVSSEMPDNSTKHIHQNKLSHYVASSNSVNIIFEEEKEFGQVETPTTATEESKFYEVLGNLEIDNLSSYN